MEPKFFSFVGFATISQTLYWRRETKSTEISIRTCGGLALCFSFIRTDSVVCLCSWEKIANIRKEREMNNASKRVTCEMKKRRLSGYNCIARYRNWSQLHATRIKIIPTAAEQEEQEENRSRRVEKSQEFMNSLGTPDRWTFRLGHVYRKFVSLLSLHEKKTAHLTATFNKFYDLTVVYSWERRRWFT